MTLTIRTTAGSSFDGLYGQEVFALSGNPAGALWRRDGLYGESLDAQEIDSRAPAVRRLTSEDTANG